jgi:hypothetical protein
MRWSGPRFPLAGLALLVWGAARPCVAGESYLDRNAGVHEAVPYGRSSDATPAGTGAVTPRAEDHTPAAGRAPTPAR